VRVAVITISDRAARGEYEDLSGNEIEKELRSRHPDVDVSRAIVADEPEMIRAALERFHGADFILTTGGTGISPRDVTPEVTRSFCDRELPGIAETLRAESYRETPSAMLSRAFAGVKGSTIVVNFPGSLNAARLGVKLISPVMEHALKMLKGEGH
jgi:molybdenum cofactor synthesis domain-containing protein